MQFSELLTKLNNASELPFIIDFTIAPFANDCQVKNVGGFNFPIYNGLLARESYLIALLNEHFGYDAALAKTEELIVSLAKELSVAIGEQDLVKCLGYVYETPEEVQQHKNFPIYSKATLGAKTELSKLSKTLDNPQLKWAKVTVFVCSRFDANWSFSRTANLTNAQIDAVLEFITEESQSKPQQIEGFTEIEKTTPQSIDEMGK